jgi:CTP:molybdopterin cytidylyltransferase MocA
MLRIWQKKPDIVVATKYGEKYGVPCLFPAEMVPRLVDCEGDRGAGPLLNSGTIEIVGLDAGKLNVDFDTETDLLGL